MNTREQLQEAFTQLQQGTFLDAGAKVGWEVGGSPAGT
jgi:hypothetical protein